MKTLCLFVVALLVMFVTTCRGDSYGKSREVEDDPQDPFTNKVNERREKIFDPRCVIWTRRKACVNGKRSFRARPVSIFPFSLALTFRISSHEGEVHTSLNLKASFNGVRNPKRSVQGLDWQNTYMKL